nr:hypothetical protein [Tanacetum cinerariifolium]
MSEQIARDAEIVRIHAEEELQIMIDGLDRNNKTITKYLPEYHQFALELPIERRIELISDLVKYQDDYAKIYKFQGQQRKPWTKKQKRDYYMAVIEIEDFIPMGSKEEAKRIKRKAKDKEIFMLVEKDYPLKKGFALVMISYKLQVENYSRMANDLILKIYKIASTSRQQGIEFPLAEEVPTASEEGCHCQKKREATARKITLLSKSRRNCQSKSNDSFTKVTKPTRMSHAAIEKLVADKAAEVIAADHA